MCRVHPNGEKLDATGECLGCALEAERNPKDIHQWARRNPYWHSIPTAQIGDAVGATREASAAVKSFYWEPEERDRLYVPVELRITRLKERLAVAGD